MSEKRVEFWVGFFVIGALLALALLAFSIAGISIKGQGKSYTLYANFTNIGGLKERSPVKLGGVVVGRVEKITLDVQNYTPRVRLSMYAQKGYYPRDILYRYFNLWVIRGAIY